MKYINTTTGAVIETASIISGGDWKLVEEKKKTKKKESSKEESESDE